MNFKIEFSDEHFRLILITPEGVEEFLEAVLFCSVSSVVGPDGVVYGAYLTGSERDLDQLNQHPSMVSMVSQSIKVYDLTAWPALKPVPGIVTLEEADFVEEEAEEDDDEGEVIEVQPV